MKLSDDVLNQLKGKTIDRAEQNGCNCLSLYFTDGTHLELEVEYVGSNLYAIGGELK